jgi:hypothetical protein
MATLSKQQVEILKAVLTYVQQHPDARDTLDGIRQWWLPASLRVPRDDLRHVLDFLVSAGWLQAMQRGSSAVVYGGDPKLKTETPDLNDLSRERLQ